MYVFFHFIHVIIAEDGLALRYPANPQSGERRIQAADDCQDFR
jgi:hypothetical protein